MGTSMIVEENDEYEISGILGKADPSSSTSTRTSLISSIASSIGSSIFSFPSMASSIPFKASVASQVSYSGGQGETYYSDYDLSEYDYGYKEQGESIYRECTITLFSLTHLRG